MCRLTVPCLVATNRWVAKAALTQNGTERAAVHPGTLVFFNFSTDLR